MDFRRPAAARAADRLIFLPLFCARRRAMRFNCGRVDEDLRRRAAGLSEHLENAGTHALLRPSDEAVVERHPRPEVRRGIHPSAPRFQHVHNAADHPPVVDPLLAARVRRQMRRDLRELPPVSQNCS